MINPIIIPVRIEDDVFVRIFYFSRLPMNICKSGTIQDDDLGLEHLLIETDEIGKENIFRTIFHFRFQMLVDVQLPRARCDHLQPGVVESEIDVGFLLVLFLSVRVIATNFQSALSVLIYVDLTGSHVFRFIQTHLGKIRIVFVYRVSAKEDLDVIADADDG